MEQFKRSANHCHRKLHLNFVPVVLLSARGLYMELSGRLAVPNGLKLLRIVADVTIAPRSSARLSDACLSPSWNIRGKQCLQRWPQIYSRCSKWSTRQVGAWAAAPSMLGCCGKLAVQPPIASCLAQPACASGPVRTLHAGVLTLRCLCIHAHSHTVCSHTSHASSRQAWRISDRHVD